MLRARYKLYGRTQEAQLRFRAIRDVNQDHQVCRCRDFALRGNALALCS
jgi:hypothetical protein